MALRESVLAADTQAVAIIQFELKSIRAGNLVHIIGYLVEVTNKDGFRWTSLLTRSDTGAGACELV